MSKFTSSSGRKSRDKREDIKQQKAAANDTATNGNEPKKFKSSGASSDQASSSLAALPEPTQLQREQAEEINRLAEKLKKEAIRADNAEQERDELRAELTSANNRRAAQGDHMTSGLRKKFKDLSTTRQEEIITQLEESLAGSEYSVVKDGEIPKVDVEKSFSLFYMKGFTQTQYKEVTKVPKFATYYAIQKFGKELLEKVGNFEERLITYVKNGKSFSVKVIIASDIQKLVSAYIEHLLRTEWDGVLPKTAVRIVFCGDKGGSSTKLGFYVPTNVQAPLSPKRFIVLAAWEGNEDYEAMKAAADDIFKFIASVQRDDLPFIMNNRDFKLPVSTMFTGDFKILSTVLGHQGSSATHFCIKCDVKRAQHKTEPTKGTPRDFDSMYQEGLIVTSIKREPLLLGLTPTSVGSPSLHILTGLASTLLKLAKEKDSGKVDEVLKNAHVTTVPGKGVTLNGNNMSRLLDYLSTEDSDFPYLDVFQGLHTVKSFAVAQELSPEEIDQLGKAIDDFSASYRSYPELNRINKLHELETHTPEFVKANGSWGLYSEQSLEGVHKFSNKADRQSFGINQHNNVKLFVERQLFCAFSVGF